MIENTVSYPSDVVPPEDVQTLISTALTGDNVPRDDRENGQSYAIVRSNGSSTHIILGYYLPKEAAMFDADTVFSQEFKIRVLDDGDENQILYHSIPINPVEHLEYPVDFVQIEEEAYHDFVEALTQDGLFEWKPVEERLQRGI